jgi:hypothetical protein
LIDNVGARKELLGPVVAILSFVCSVENVPLDAVLWSGGISFGGVVAFLFADLIVLPILEIYRKYYGEKGSALLLAIFYVSMAGAALVIQFIFGALSLIPNKRRTQLIEKSIRWNDGITRRVLDLAFLALGLILVIRFLRTGGPDMLRMMIPVGQPAAVAPNTALPESNVRVRRKT